MARGQQREQRQRPQQQQQQQQQSRAKQQQCVRVPRVQGCLRSLVCDTPAPLKACIPPAAAAGSHTHHMHSCLRCGTRCCCSAPTTRTHSHTHQDVQQRVGRELHLQRVLAIREVRRCVHGRVDLALLQLRSARRQA
jgi:hypothetical protein